MMSYQMKKIKYSLISMAHTFLATGKESIWDRTSLWVPKKGSLTVEAAMAFPFAVCLIGLLLSFFQVQRFQAGIGKSLSETGNIIVSSVPSGGNPMLTQAEVTSLLLEKMGRRGLSVNRLENQFLTIQTGDSDDEYLRVTLTYRLKLPVSLYQVQGPKQTLTMSFRYWTQGREETENDQETWVYITETGTVYHKETSCYHLKLSIQQIARDQLMEARNQGGAKYYPCELCGEKEHEDWVYITKEGNRYHTTLSCSGLKRTILRVKLSELTGYGPCSNCWKGE